MTLTSLAPRFSPSLHRILRIRDRALIWMFVSFLVHLNLATATVSSRDLLSSSSSATTTTTTPLSFSIRLPGNRYVDDDDEDWGLQDRSWMGSGREFSIFDSRGGSSRSNFNHKNNNNEDDDDDDGQHQDEDSRTKDIVQRYRRARLVSNRNRFRSSPGFLSSSSSSFPRRTTTPEFFQTAQTWWSAKVAPNLEKMPKIVCRVEPTTTLKLRKTFRPLKTIIRLGADFNTQLGVWQFQSSWEDAIIGGKLTLAGKELQLTKSWQLSVGAVEDLVTRLRFRAAINLQTFQAYARVGFRTERLSPINVMEGFTILKRLPLDGGRGNVKLEVKAKIALPEPEFEYSTETQRSLIGNMGDVEVSIDELNLLLDY